MFERFTERARQVVVLAQDEARALGHDHIGTEHLLLGLLGGEGTAAAALDSLGIAFEDVRTRVIEVAGQGVELTTGQIPFTPRAKKVLELAVTEMRSLGRNAVEPEHILLGLAREKKGKAMRILVDLGADAETVANEVTRFPLGTPSEESPRRPRVVMSQESRTEDPAWLARRLGAIEASLHEILVRLEAIEGRLEQD